MLRLIKDSLTKACKRHFRKHAKLTVTRSDVRGVRVTGQVLRSEAAQMKRPTIQLIWPSVPVKATADTDLHEKLNVMTEEELIHAFATAALPEHDGLTEKQATNLLRHTLRDKIGKSAFDSLPVMGGPDGAKEVACLFEQITESFLASKGVFFKTETDQIRDWEITRGRILSSPRPLFSARHAAAFHPTGGLDSKGRPLFQGSCYDCGDACTLPFKPFKNMRTPPKCVSCHIGKLMNTPDFVFDQNALHINGHPIAWLDCKCFYGSSCSAFTLHSLSEQASRFNKKFGPGALVFAFGFSEGLHIDSTLLLDAIPLDLAKLLSALEQGPQAKALRGISAMTQPSQSETDSKPDDDEPSLEQLQIS